MGNVIDLQSLEVIRQLKPGRGPRHIVLDAAGRLFVSLSHEGRVAIIDKESGATVSRVLNNPALVAASTAARVQATIHKLGYKPNIFAKGLMTRRSRVLFDLVAPSLQIVLGATGGVTLAWLRRFLGCRTW